MIVVNSEYQRCFVDYTSLMQMVWSQTWNLQHHAEMHSHAVHLLPYY